MTAPIAPVATPAVHDPRRMAKLREAASQLEGLFVRQLYSAMRETVPTDGPLSGGAGEDMFTGLLDEKLADATPAQWSDHGLAAGIARQFQRRLEPTLLPGGQP